MKTERKADVQVVPRETVEHQAFVILRRLILEGTFKPGRRIVQDETARQLGTSRIPIRAALQKLHSSGLVVTDARGAYYVAKFEADEMAEIYGLRQLLEPYAAQLALPFLDATLIEELRALTSDMEQAAESGDADSWSDLNYSFHMGIYAQCKQKRLYRIIEDLWLTRPSFSPIKKKGDMRNSAIEHRDMLDCIARGDGDGLARQLRHHIASAATRWRDMLEQR